MVYLFCILTADYPRTAGEQRMSRMFQINNQGFVV